MSRWMTQRRPRGSRVVIDELYNREGHWTRQFPVRVDPWSIIEHWAAENKYYLVAFRGQRRLYQKECGWNSFKYLTYVDIKCHDGKLTLSTWIHVSFALRFLSLFLMPSEMDLDPHGLIGVRKRRQTSREMNSLLLRFRQHEIIGSGGIHFMDLDWTTIALGGKCFLALFLSLYVTTLKLQVYPAIANVLLWQMGKHMIALTATAIGLVALHDLVVIRKWDLPLYKWISSAVGIVTFTVLTIWLTMQTGKEMQFSKMSYHCWYRYHTTYCNQALSRLSPGEREMLLQQIQRLQSEIAIRK